MHYHEVMLRKQGGYAGLIGIMVSVAIIGFLFAKVYLIPNKQPDEVQKFQPNTASGTVPMTEIDQMHADVDAATAVQTKLNAHNKEVNSILGE